MGNFTNEFRTFLMRGNAVDLAVGVVIGAAFSTVVKSIVDGLFMPVIGVLTGGIDFSGYAFTLYKDAKLGVGTVIQALINFIIVGFCLFLVVKAMNRLTVKKDAPPPEPPATEKLLAEIRDLLKNR